MTTLVLLIMLCAQKIEKKFVIEKVIKENKVKSHLIVQLLSFILTTLEHHIIDYVVYTENRKKVRR